MSDRCSRGEAADKSGPAIAEALSPGVYEVVERNVVPDEPGEIAAVLVKWADSGHCDLILSTGGTGFSPRDITPEATRKVIEREAPNLAQFLLTEGLKSTPFAALSRGIAGIRGRTLIVNLPGSTAGARDGTTALLPLLPHAIDVLKSQEQGHPA